MHVVRQDDFILETLLHSVIPGLAGGENPEPTTR